MRLGHIADYVLDPLHSPSDSSDVVRTYMQFLTTIADTDNKKVHANQIIIIKSANEIPEVKLSPIGLDNPIEWNKREGIAWIQFDKYGNFITPEMNNVISEWGNSGAHYYMGINLNIESPLEVVSKGDDDTVWIEYRFVPYLYKLTKINNEIITGKDLTDEDRFRKRVEETSYKINRGDVICFLPNIRSSVLPKDFMWEYKCRTDNSVINPKTFREIPLNDNKPSNKRFPTILQPFFGKYEIGAIPSKGFYDVTFRYKLDSGASTSEEKTVTSSFIIE
jgi:hypothetical protein